jgi:hypothetical protein
MHRRPCCVDHLAKPGDDESGQWADLNSLGHLHNTHDHRPPITYVSPR